MIEKQYIVKHCSNYKTNKKWYETHYYNGKGVGMMFSDENYARFLQFTSLLKECGYKYIENEEKY